MNIAKHPAMWLGGTAVAVALVAFGAARSALVPTPNQSEAIGRTPLTATGPSTSRQGSVLTAPPAAKGSPQTVTFTLVTAPAPPAPPAPPTPPGRAIPPPSPDPAPPVPEGDAWATVTQVLDGMTVEVLFAGGGSATVRYIGIETPAEGCFAAEAAARNRELLAGKRVWLERDVSDRDAEGRMLRHVYLEDNTMVSAALVAVGLARAVAQPPDGRHGDLLESLQRQASEEGRGLWGACAGLGGTPRDAL